METSELHHEKAPGLTSLTEPDGGSRIFHAPLAEQSTGCEPVKPPDRLLHETEQTPAIDNTASSSRHSGPWPEIVSAFGGLEASGTSFEKSGCAAGGFVDSFAVFETSIAEKSTACVLVER